MNVIDFVLSTGCCIGCFKLDILDFISFVLSSGRSIWLVCGILSVSDHCFYLLDTLDGVSLMSLVFYWVLSWVF